MLATSLEKADAKGIRRLATSGGMGVVVSKLPWPDGKVVLECGKLDRSVRYQQVLEPAGIRYELRAAFVTRGRCWGAVHIARLDGCSHWSAFLRVALPLAKPGIVATGILSFIFSWNNFLFSLIIAGFKTRTLPIAVYSFLSYEEINWGGLTAAATIITLPVLILAMLVQKHIVRGLTFGALKG
jgi:hypothetical protein